MTSKAEKAALLKKEGNDLFINGKFKPAYQKYTLAIEAEASASARAILLSNRAACSLSLRKYREAADDARKATELDPGYCKAWARLGAALKDLRKYAEAIEAYQNAINALPNTDLTPEEKKQKASYESAIKGAKSDAEAEAAAKIERERRHQISPAQNRGQDPWDRARKIMPELLQKGDTTSSAHVILQAYDEFNTANLQMNMTKETLLPNGVPAIMGPLDCIVGFTNAILRDERVFHIERGWIAKYNRQTIMEVHQFGGWKDEGPEEVFDAACRRLEQQGWDRVRPALAITVRAWIMTGLHYGGLHNDKAQCLIYYTWALEILNRGREVWQNVSTEDRGVIFDDTFVTGVRTLHLEAHHSICNQESQNRAQNARKLLKLAQRVVDDIKASEKPTGTSDVGFKLSFYDYPLARALAIVGWCHKRLARCAAKDLDDVRAKLRLSGKCYVEAGHLLPEDDEKRYWYLSCGMSSYFRAGTASTFMLPLLEEVRLGVPKARAIWENSVLFAGQGSRTFKRYLIVEEDLHKALAEGSITLETEMMPDSDEDFV